MINKRGQSWKPWIWVGVIFLFFIFAWFVVKSEFFRDWSRDFSVDTAVVSFDTFLGDAFGWMDFVFGGVPGWLVDRVGATSAVIITLATFLFIFVTFGDIIRSFSTFSSPVSWIASFLIAVIAANLKAIVVVLGFFIGIFAFLGGIAVLIGLIAAFVAFVAVNWGVGSLGPWVFRRRAMMIAERKAGEIAANAKTIRGTIEGLGEIGEGLKRLKK